MPGSKTGNVISISRRTVVRAGSAAGIVSGLAAKGFARDERYDTYRSDCRTSGTTERQLSQTFRRNADGFYRAATGAPPGFPEIGFHSLAIAIELSLKAYLLHRGVGDDWNRIHIGHDLRLALACARRAGLRQVSDGVSDLAASLTLFYEQHAFSRSMTAAAVPLTLPQTCEAVRGLLCRVGEQIDHEAAIGGCRTLRRRRDVHA